MKFVFDLDGTICFKGQPVSEKLLNGLEVLESQGHEVFLHRPGRSGTCCQCFTPGSTAIRWSEGTAL